MRICRVCGTQLSDGEFKYNLGNICRKCWYQYTKPYTMKARKTNPEANRKWERKPENKIKRRKYFKIYTKDRRYRDINYHLRMVLSSRIRNALRGVGKNERTMNLIGCSIEQFRDHIESKFQTGMTWNNYGEWHIDHIFPLSRYDLTKEENQKAAFHFTNMQPLWAKDNMAKGNRLNWRAQIG